MRSRLWRYLLAILLGNAIYFGIERYLPPLARHEPYRVSCRIVRLIRWLT